MSIPASFTGGIVHCEKNMFIRKRINRTKNYGISESYQVIETYRENGKVKQRYICNLGRCSTPELALKKARDDLQNAEYWRNQPISPRWASGKWKGLKVIAEEKHYREKRFIELKQKIEKLESVVSKLSRRQENSDTTRI